jgi:uncharacterized protein (DUF58 family)
MRVRVAPSGRLLFLVAFVALAALVALLLSIPLRRVAMLSVIGAGALLFIAIADYLQSLHAWRRAGARLTRKLPPAFAIGVKREVNLAVDIGGREAWHVGLHDHADPSMIVTGLPVRLTLPANKRTETSYRVTPTRRGEIVFAPADLRLRSRWGLCELFESIGMAETRRVYPDFAQIARYAWLAGDRRLQEIGIKTYQQRGEGTDFKQLSEYRYGDPVRHIDWKATLRIGKPIVREFQDERDQCIMLLLDCGRRMRADDRQGDVGTAHFDQVLNAVMLLSYVALQQGDAVGALTFGTPPGAERSFAPRKGSHALNALMGELYGVQPTPTHSDYVAAAQNLLRRYGKRALVIVITNFRDEDSSELGHALRLLRSRHLVLLASLRERVVGELVSSPLVSGEAALDVASAHLYEQSRRDAFNRLAARDALMVDAEPERLGVELVNRYHAVKRAGMI